MYPFGRFFFIFTAVLFAGCSALRGMQQHSTVCEYDNAWESALNLVKDRSLTDKDKEAGLIATDWLEMPIPGRAYGIFRRDMGENSKDRSRVIIHVKRLNDAIQVGFIEERQSWVFRGGSRLFGWAPAHPSAEVMQDLENRLDLKLKERGCSLSSY